VEADQPDDEYYRRDVTGYFPEELQKRYAKEIGQHQLAHEIAATVVTNSIVNRAGAHFVFDMLERTGKDVSSVVRAYLVAREVFRLRDIWRGIEELDNHVAAKLQTSMHHIVLRVMNGAIHWFLSSLDMQGPLEPIMEAYGKSIAQLAAWLDKHAARINGVMKKSEHELLGQGVPAPLARSLARLPVLATALDLTQLVTKSRGDIGTVAEIYFALGQKLGFDWLSERAHALVAQTPWQREAVADVLGDLTNVQRRLTALVAGTGKSGKDRTPQEKFAAWLERNTERLESYNAMLTEWRGVGAVDISMLTLASRQLARIAEGH
jgi:glutamate dehydrogenase